MHTWGKVTITCAILSDAEILKSFFLHDRRSHHMSSPFIQRRLFHGYLYEPVSESGVCLRFCYTSYIYNTPYYNSINAASSSLHAHFNKRPLILAGSSLASLQLFQVPTADLHVSLLLVHTSREIPCVHITSGSLLAIVRLVILWCNLVVLLRRLGWCT